MVGKRPDKTIIFNSKVGVHLVNLEKLIGTKSSVEDQVEQIRILTTKILHLLTANEKSKQDCTSKPINGVPILIQALQACVEQTQIVENIVKCFGELSHNPKRARELVQLGVVPPVLSCLTRTFNSSQPPNTALLASIHDLLARIGPKDKKFSTRARLSGALGVTLALTRNCTANSPHVSSYLQVLRVVSINSINSQQLGRSGAISCLLKLGASGSKKHPFVIRLALEILSNLAKSRGNVARMIGFSGVQVFLTIHSEWHTTDLRNKQLALRKLSLSLLKTLTNHKNGRKAFQDIDGLKVLYATCYSSLGSSDLEPLIQLSLFILRRCLPKQTLPLNNLFSAYVYKLPHSDSTAPPLERPSRETDVEEDDEEVDLSEDDSALLYASREPILGDLLENEEDTVGSTSNLAGEDSGAETTPAQDGHAAWASHINRGREDLEQYSEFCLECSTKPEQQHSNNYVLPNYSFNDMPSDNSISQSTDSSDINRILARHSIPARFSSLGNIFAVQEDECSVTTTSELGSPLTFGAIGNRNSSKALPRSNTTTELAATRRKRLPTSTPYLAPAQTNRALPKLPLTANQVALSQRLMKSTKKTLKSSSVPNFGSLPQGRASTPSNVIRIPSGSNRPVNSLTQSTASVHSSSLISSRSLEKADQPEETRSPVESAEYPSPYRSVQRFTTIASHVKAAVKFRKIAIPDAYGHNRTNIVEPYKEEKAVIARYKMFEDFERFLFPSSLIQAVVFDLDDSINDKPRAHVDYCDKTPTLKFASMFECGNLRKAIQVREREYDLILNTDVNANAFTQWFYFEVSNMKADVEYRFNIINCEKPNSQFNFGMQPLVYSVQDMLGSGEGRWSRSGFSIAYYKNQFLRNPSLAGGKKGLTYFTLTFSLKFKHSDDIVYIAYHYPFTYSMLLVHLEKLEQTAAENDVYYKQQNLCNTIAGNPCPLITIASKPPSHLSYEEAAQKLNSLPVIYLSSRVHPGESNSSWVMMGTLNFLVSAESKAVRDQYLFKVIPMLNPDGVINGNYRCSLTGQDLNRLWLNPSPDLHPTIYHAKGLLQYLIMSGRKPFVFCDYHGHSRRKNVFMYGCSMASSWYSVDQERAADGEDQCYRELPKTLSYSAPAFSLPNCSNLIEKVKETTARVVVWRHLGITRSYTMESTFSGFEIGPYKGTQIGTRELCEMGMKFAEALVRMKNLFKEKTSVEGSETSRLPLSTTNSFNGTSLADSETSLQMSSYISRNEPEEEDFENGAGISFRYRAQLESSPEDDEEEYVDDDDDADNDSPRTTEPQSNDFNEDSNDDDKDEQRSPSVEQGDSSSDLTIDVYHAPLPVTEESLNKPMTATICHNDSIVKRNAVVTVEAAAATESTLEAAAPQVADNPVVREPSRSGDRAKPTASREGSLIKSALSKKTPKSAGPRLTVSRARSNSGVSPVGRLLAHPPDARRYPPSR